MRKLNLSLDALTVDSFDPSPSERGYRGTVQGNSLTPDTAGGTCENCNTVDVTYCGNNTCYTDGGGATINTCAGSPTCPPAKGCYPIE